ncbi:MAG TPA: DUF1328 domain-containing protein [Ancylobacter sp.]
MLKFAVIALLVSLLAGAIGMTTVSTIAQRISLILFGLFFLGFLLLLALALFIDEMMQTAMLVGVGVA